MSEAVEKVRTFVKDHRMAILSTVSDNGEPWGSAIIFAIDEDLNFYFMTRSDTLKFKNVEANQSVAITVADEEQQITVQTSGKISRLEAKKDIDLAYKLLARVKPRGDFQWTPPVTRVHGGDYMILRLSPSKLQYGDFKPRKTDVHSKYIEQII